MTPGRPGSSGPARARYGVTIAELAVVLVLIGVIGSTIGLSLVRQQRFYRSATELLRAREGVRDAMELLASDVRGMSVADTVRLLADSAIEFFANVGSSVVCDYDGGTAVGLPGLSPRKSNALTSFITEPDTGDMAFFHRDSSDGVSEWEGHRINGFAARSLSTSCPAASRFGRQADAGFLLDLFSRPSPRVGAGAPVRFVRRGRYSLYHASDGRWYLGFRRCNAVGPSLCGAIQPLSGPYRGYSTNPGKSGLLFEYFDGSGARLAPGTSPLALARVDITARTESRQWIGLEGWSSAPSDSATIAIAIRNRSP